MSGWTGTSIICLTNLWCQFPFCPFYNAIALLAADSLVFGVRITMGLKIEIDKQSNVETFSHRYDICLFKAVTAAYRSNCITVLRWNTPEVSFPQCPINEAEQVGLYAQPIAKYSGFSLVMASYSKCGFGRDRKKSLKCGNRVSYCAENVVWPTQKPFQCGRFVVDRPHFESQVMAITISMEMNSCYRHGQCSRPGYSSLIIFTS